MHPAKEPAPSRSVTRRTVQQKSPPRTPSQTNTSPMLVGARVPVGAEVVEGELVAAAGAGVAVGAGVPTAGVAVVDGAAVDGTAVDGAAVSTTEGLGMGVGPTSTAVMPTNRINSKRQWGHRLQYFMPVDNYRRRYIGSTTDFGEY